MKDFIVFIIGILLQYNTMPSITMQSHALISDFMFCSNSKLLLVLERNHFKGLLSGAASSRDGRLRLTLGRDSVKLF